MKIALYIEDGYEQLALTPQTDAEKAILDKLNNEREFYIKKGEFYHCQGGWARHGNGEESTMIVFTEKSA